MYIISDFSILKHNLYAPMYRCQFRLPSQNSRALNLILVAQELNSSQ